MNSKISILLVENDLREQINMRDAIQMVDSSIDVEHLYEPQQLPDFLFKEQIQRDLNRQVLPDLVLVNVESPCFDLSVFSRIRKHFDFVKLPIYFLSPSEIFPAVAVNASTCGITKVFKKPSTLVDLSRVIQNMIGESSAALAV